MKPSTLFAMGYEDLIPVEGKAPKFKGWPEYQASLEDAAAWDAAPHNVGLLTARFPAIDCDITDEDAALRVLVAIKEVFGVRTPMRVGKHPKFLALTRLPDTTAPQRKMKVGLVSPTGEVHYIEVLGQGQQFVVAGTHPDTKKPYTWVQPLVPVSELPEFTEERFTRFINTVREKLTIIGWSIGDTTVTGTRTVVNPKQLYAPSVEYVAAAAEYLYNGPDVPREVFVQVAHAIKGSVRPEDDARGMEIFMEWAARGPEDRDPEEAERVWRTVRRDNVSIGWDNLRQSAEKSGWNGAPAAVAQAQQEFEPVVDAPPEDECPITLEDVENHETIARYVQNDGRRYFTTGDNDWFLWDGIRWKTDPMRQEHTKGTIARQLSALGDALAEKYGGEGKKLAATLRKLKSVTYVNTIFSRVGMNTEVFRDRSTVNDTDTHKFTLNTPTGTYDLRTLQMSNHRRDDYITQTTAVAPNFDAECPEFMQFLLTSCGEDESLVEYVLSVLGSALTTDTSERLIWFLTGESGAGKSTLLKHMHAILGDYSGICPQGALIHGEQTAHQSAVAGFRDKRFIHGSEIDRGHKWNVALLKSITGNEVITARRLYHEYEDFTVVGKFIIAGNETPTLPNVDSAMRARLRVVRFHAPLVADPNLDAKLQTEYPAILALLIRHANKWIEDGYPYCESVRSMTDEYFTDEDLLGQFVEQFFAYDANGCVTVDEAFAMWETYTTHEQRREYGIKTKIALSKALRANPKLSSDSRKIDGKTYRVIAGLRKVEEVPASLEDLM